MASFFNSTYDENAKYIISIDFSHFDSSLITDTNSLFYGCSSLLKLDLSNFITNPETSMENMFSGCDNLKYLDISGFNINSYDILNGLSNLTFINLYKAQNYEINAINNITKNLSICQKEKRNLDIENKCGYYNIDTGEFDSTNLIIIYFNKDVEYKSGFSSGIENRNNIEFLINGNDDKINANESLSIKKGKKLEIYLNKETTNLKSFFDSDLDPNMLYVKSIDFTLFDSSKVTNMENLFKGCSELDEIDFTNFNTTLVTSIA